MTDNRQVDLVAIAGRSVGLGQPCFIIAEAGVNHNGSLDTALRLVDAARQAGADAVKFQLYRIDEILSGATPTADYQRRHTGSESFKKMAEAFDLPWPAHQKIAAHCADAGIQYMASCFDKAAVDFYLQLGGEALKVGSGEITNYPLLAHMAASGKPVLLSTGMSTWEDVAGAVGHLQAHGNPPLVLFHCVSNYPTRPETVNLRVLPTLAQAFAVPVGFSDHTPGLAVSVAAVALGASLIEKHFTLDRNATGPDHAMSLDPTGLCDFIAAIREAELSLGSSVKQLQPGEAEVQRVARRSLVSARAIQAGERLDLDNVTLKRPATGLDPRSWPTIRGRTAAKAIPQDTPITLEMLR